MYHAFRRLAALADEAHDVMRAVIVGPPSRAVRLAEVELPGPVELERGDVERIVGQPVEPEPARPGLIPCATCSTEQAPREGGRLAVHFPTREAIRPCAGSWPPPAKARTT